MTRSILPPNSTRIERALEIVSDRLTAPAVDSLWDAWLAPERFLPWLAYAVGVREWDPLWPLDTRRQVIASQIAINRHRGTRWAVRQSLIAMGYADATLDENLGGIERNGATLRDGSNTRDESGRWAFFRIVADLGNDKGINEVERRRLSALIDAAKPVRSVLKELAYVATVSDQVAQDDRLAIAADLSLSDLITVGPARDGSVLRNGSDSRRYTADKMELSANFELADSHSSTTPLRDGSAQRDGIVLRGDQTASILDSVGLSLSVSVSDQHAAIEEVLGLSADLGLVEYPLTSRPRNASITRDGTVARDGHQDAISLTGELSWADSHEAFGNRSGAFRRDGQIRHGGQNAWSVDAIALSITKRRFRNNRLIRDGSQLRSPQYSYSLTA